MTINVNEICNELPGLTSVAGRYLFEACAVCLKRQNHSSSGTTLFFSGDAKIEMNMTWDDIYNENVDKTWKDQEYATEHGAVCLSILTVLKLTEYTVVERSRKKTGFDYWLGSKDDKLFQNKARLEVSGIFNGSESDIKRRYQVKIKQTDQSDSMKIPAFVGVVEFSRPHIMFGMKK